MTKEVFEYRTFTRLNQYLIRTKQIDPQFFWTSDVGAFREQGRANSASGAVPYNFPQAVSVTRNSTRAFWLANCRTRIVNRVACE